MVHARDGERCQGGERNSQKFRLGVRDGFSDRKEEEAAFKRKIKDRHAFI